MVLCGCFDLDVDASSPEDISTISADGGTGTLSFCFALCRVLLGMVAGFFLGNEDSSSEESIIMSASDAVFVGWNWSGLRL